MSGLKIEGLRVEVAGREILHGVDLEIKRGQIHALMGPNGSGKSSLALSLMGHPGYEIKQGRIVLDGADITKITSDERARRGLFLAFQYPSSISGVTLLDLLRSSYTSKFSDKKLTYGQLRKEIEKKMEELSMDISFLERAVNDGFSGGEKKRSEILQMAVIKPNFAILDETDSGLDIDALKTVADGVKRMVGKNLGVLVITHYQRLLHYLKPDIVHVMMEGKIVKMDGKELVGEIERKGYSFLKD